MKPSRSHIGMLMVLVGVVGIDLAVSRSFLNESEAFGYDLGRYVSVTPMAVILQFAAFRVVASRGARRVFWAGFLASGLVAISTDILAVADPRKETAILAVFDPQKGTMAFPAAGTTTEFYPGGPATRAWSAYLSLADEGLERLHYPWSDGNGYYWTLAIQVLLPQLVFARTGGLLTRRLMDRFRPTIGLPSPPGRDGPASWRDHPLP